MTPTAKEGPATGDHERLHPRWGGHTRVHISIAEHQVRVAGWLREHGASVAVQLQGVAHDIHEATAFPGDLAGPLFRDDNRAICLVESEIQVATVVDKDGLRVVNGGHIHMRRIFGLVVESHPRAAPTEAKAPA